MNFQSPEYFKDLVLRFTSSKNLAQIGVDQNNETTGDTETIPLYQSNGEGEVELNDTASGEGIALAMRILPAMVGLHVHVRLQQELSSILDRKSTSNEQLERVGALLDQHGNSASKAKPGVVSYTDMGRLV